MRLIGMRALGVAFVVCVLAVPGCTSSRPTPTPTPTPVAVVTSPEPRPYPGDRGRGYPLDDLVRPVSRFTVRPGELPVPWTLIGVVDAGRALWIRYGFDCGDEPGRVQAVETSAAVTISVLQPPLPPGPRPACLRLHEPLIRLSRPLGTRSLLHVLGTAP